MSRSAPRFFDPFELGNAIPKAEYQAAVPGLRVDLVNMQYDLRDADFPALVILAGDARKDVNEALDVLHEWMDARYLDTHAMLMPAREELEYPTYWRYWRALPAHGRIGVHLGGWPMMALAQRLVDDGTDAGLERQLEHINALERSLVADGTVLIKLWLHAPAREAKRRLKKARKKPESELYVNERDRRIHEVMERGLPFVERVLGGTDTGDAPWHIVESTDSRFRDLSIARTILSAVRGRLDAPPPPASVVESSSAPFAITQAGALDTVDLASRLERDEYRERLERQQRKLSRLVREARDRVATVLVFEGWDAAGKGGVIRRLTHAMFAQDYRVVSIAAPTDEERAHHYLWRFWRKIPRDGSMTIFDRTWYGRVLVERVEGFASEEQWRRAYAEINDFERQLVEHGTVFCKFWLHIDPDEQLRRFQAREKTGYKKYKITEEDYRNREKWDAYTGAVNEMIARTSTPDARWHLVPANDKPWARVQVIETVVDAMKRRLKEI